MDALQELLAAGGTLDEFFTPAYVAQAQAYVAPLRLKSTIDLALTFVVFAVIFAFGLHVKLFNACALLAERWGAAPRLAGMRRIGERIWKGPGLGAAALFLLGMFLCLNLIDLPESIYFNYIREKREGLSHYTPVGFAWDTTKGMLISAVVLTTGMLAIYALMRWMPRWWAPVMGGVGALVLLGSAALDPLREQVYATYAPLPDGPIRAAILDTLKKGHVEFQNVVVEDMSRTTSRADAYFAGEGPTRLIVLGDTLLHGYQPEEIAAIVAHEMGHLGEPRWTPRLLSALAAFLGVLGIQQLLGFCARRRWFGLGAPTDIVGYLLIFFAFELISVAVTPIANWRSRTRESDADAYALRLTGDAQHFLSMMAKLTTQNRADPIPPLYMELWRAGHPASARRLAMGLRYASAHGLRLVLPPPQDASKAGNGEAAAPTPERAPSLEPRTPDAPPTSSLQPPTPP